MGQKRKTRPETHREHPRDNKLHSSSGTGLSECASHSALPIDKFGAENDIGIVKHSLLERDHKELGVLEVILEHAANVLSMAQIQSSVDLIQNVHRRGLE